MQKAENKSHTALVSEPGSIGKEVLSSQMRCAEVNRTTKETSIHLILNCNGSGKADIQTGLGFLDHMLTLFAFHSGFDLAIDCRGDLQVDSHHSTEDIGIALGQAIAEALGDKRGIERYGLCYLPMDEALCRCALDLSGRSYLVYDAPLKRELLGNLATEDVREFLKAVADNAKLTLHIAVLYGENDHHMVESIFKAFGRAMRMATAITSDRLASTKGVL